MKLGVISDTHDRLPAIDAAISRFADQRVDLIIHCGDWKSIATLEYFAVQAARYGLPFRGVLGNNDLDVAGFMRAARKAVGDFVIEPLVFEMTLPDGTMLATHHGHHRPTLRRLRDDAAYTILLLGHTHKPLVENTPGRVVVNPGSTAFAIPRSRDWRPTIAIVDVLSRTAEIHRLL